MSLVPRLSPRRDIGHDPDYRFTLAKERTFLAWIRTSLALIAGGLAIFQFVPDFSVQSGKAILSVALIVLGTLLAAGSVGRWASAEEAMRQKRPIPATALPGTLAIGVVIVAIFVAALLLV